MSKTTEPVPFVDLNVVHQPMIDDLRDAFERVLLSGGYTMGAEVAAFESELADAVGSVRVVGCGSGTAALQLMLAAADIGPGDEVILPPNTFVATAEAIVAVGATPVFADVSPSTGQIDPVPVESAITPRTAAVIGVHLYGHPAPMDVLRQVTSSAGVKLFEDSAQALGASLDGVPAGRLGDGAAFSFYPGKNLGALGEAGAVTTQDPALAERIAVLRAHGEKSKHVHVVQGVNERLDEMQAAFLRVKLRYFDEGQQQRVHAVERYRAGLDGIPDAEALDTAPNVVHANHLFPVRVPQRDVVLERLRDDGVFAAVHYPTPIHLQPAFEAFAGGPGSFPVSESLAESTVSLPLFAGITDQQIDRCLDGLINALRSAAA
ncbi:MAG TPA: DegT/DnrJ/EryC1/StrS family aminotransferase [Acidimicrobiales bacterium]|jgi:dTDP-4-amino-4,6-dideoxygalactose transaminase